MIFLLLLACPEPAPRDSTDPPETGETAEPALEPLFAFAVFADPHLSSNAEYEDRLARAVDWVNEQAAERGLELVWVVGDIGWSGGLEVASGLLETLSVPYLPVIGDNEVHFGDEANFDAVFGAHYERLGQTLQDWRRGTVEVVDPQRGETLWLQNYSFTYGGLRMVGLDWCSRDDDTLASEMATLHDFDGGSLPFLEEEISTLPDGPEENVLLFSHHPMVLFPGGFYEFDMERLTGVVAPAGARIAANYAGHLHVSIEQTDLEAGYDLYVTDAIHDDELTIRVVTVSGNGRRMTFSQELVVLE